MKKILALFLALSMLFVLAACGSGEPADSTPSTTKPTEATGTPTTNPTETPTTNPTGTGDHTHSYNSEVTQAVTCTQDGVTTFTCTCGDTYTTTETAKGHTLGDWKVYTTPSNTAPGERRKTCANCSHYEAEMLYDRMINFYTECAGFLGFFENAQQLQDCLGDVITAAVFTQSVPNEGGYAEDGRYIRIIAVSDMDAFTTKCLGTTFDYTGVDNTTVLFESTCSYDANNNTLVIISSGGGSGDEEPVKEVTYTTNDGTHFDVSITSTWYEEWVSHYTMTVDLVNGNYIITSYDCID